MKLKNKKIAFIGAGKMTEALIRGLLSSKVLPSRCIYASDVLPGRLKYLRTKYKINVRPQNIVAVSRADIIILSVKPQGMSQVLREIGPHVKSKQLVISIAAGIKMKNIKRFVGKVPVVRVMPNNPCFVGEGVSAISTSRSINTSKIAEIIFSSVGKVVFVPPKLMDAVTALSGSGPAFIYLVAEALIDGGRAAGLNSSVARRLAVQTILGSAKTIIDSGKTPEELRTMVTSPGGTTLAGLKVLDKYKFKKALISAIISAAKRSRELGKLYNP